MPAYLTQSDVIEDDRISPQHRRNCRRHGVVCVNVSTGLHACRACLSSWWVNQRPSLKGGGHYPGWWKCPNGCNDPD